MTHKEIYKDCTGIAVIKDDQVLLGLRRDGQGWGLAGGKREGKETLQECAERELKEEFGLEAQTLEYVGIVEAEVRAKGKEIIVQPTIFLCRHYLGKIRICKKELIKYQWVELSKVLHWEALFPPSRLGIELVIEKLNCN